MLSNSFKWKHYEGEIILLNVRWYLKNALSYRNLKENDGRQGSKSRPYNNHEMGTSIFPWNRKKDQKTFKTNKWFSSIYKVDNCSNFRFSVFILIDLHVYSEVFATERAKKLLYLSLEYKNKWKLSTIQSTNWIYLICSDKVFSCSRLLNLAG